MVLDQNSKSVYEETLKLAEDHYENFPVASILFPKNIRKKIALVYRFARTADDIADEGNFSDSDRLEMITQYRNDFISATKGEYKTKFWELLHKTIIGKNINEDHFLNLLKAFEQDVIKSRYETFEDLLNYCKNSANPVGRIILELHNVETEKTKKYSDNICTALQLTNFWQDVKIDLKKNRIYIPKEDLEKFNLSEESLFTEQTTKEVRQIIKHEVDRTEKFFAEGKKILEHLPFRLRIQIAWTINGGEKILQKIRKSNYDILNLRPTLSKVDYAAAFGKSLLM